MPRERAWEALLGHDLAASAPSKLLIALRGYGLRARRGNAGGTIADRLQRFGFTKLNEVSGEELVFGLAGRFWRFEGGLERLAGIQGERRHPPHCVREQEPRVPDARVRFGRDGTGCSGVEKFLDGHGSRSAYRSPGES